LYLFDCDMGGSSSALSGMPVDPQQDQQCAEQYVKTCIASNGDVNRLDGVSFYI
jgi:hypothetical protein